MGTITAQIIVGLPHDDYGGIRPEYVLWLSENGGAAWVLQPVAPDDWGGPAYLSRNVRSTVWVPSAREHILEDGILLVAVHALCDEAVLELVAERLPELVEARVPFQDSPVDLTIMPADVLAELRQQSAEPTWEDLKLAVTVLSDSAVQEQLPVLDRYPMQIEVCTVSYARLKPLGQPGGDDEMQVRGSFETSRSQPVEMTETTNVEMVDGYCVKERKMVFIKSPMRVMMTNGRAAIQGFCPDCGTKIFKIPDASSDVRTLTEGTFLRWIDQEPGQKPLGIVLSPPADVDENMIFVLMADDQGNTDVEVFVAREEATGVDASTLVLESMEVVEEGDPELMGLLSRFGPNWWHISAHLDGQHADQVDPECLLCAEGDEAT